MIHIENLQVQFTQHSGKTKQVLKGITLDIQENESIGIMGANGSGKSTFARCLNGLVQPTDGTVLIDDLSIFEMEKIPDIRRKVGMVFQNPDNQIVSATIEREIAFGLENLGMPIEKMKEIVQTMLEKFDLERYRNKTPHFLSGGEKQRLAIASVLAMNPKYMILDEPTSLLDPKSRRDILRIVGELHSSNDHNITTLLITQFAEEALMADRLLVFSDGRIVMDDKPEIIFDNLDEMLKIGLEPPVKTVLKKLVENGVR
jgi:energy-coupling factor transport system ATP-binding protein